MNHRLSIRLSAIFLIAIMIFASVAPTIKAQDTSRPLTILFTHDLHSHFDSNETADSSGKITESGGFARLAGVIQREKAKNQDRVLVVDAGDFSMGTLFHTLFAKEASELRLLGAMGYDATTIGNHEFDFDSSGLASMLNTARIKGGPLPAVVSSNLGFKSGQEWKSGLKKARQGFPVQDYKIVEKNGMRIGIFGLLGSDAAHDLIWGDDIQLQDPAKEAARVVKILREREKVDLIVCLSHSGTSEVKSKSEDDLLAKKVPGIDVIISGHTHTRLDQPIKVGKTIIASSGCFGDNMGILVINCPKGQNPNMISYRIEKISPDTPAVPAITNQIGNYKTLVNGEFLQDSGYTYDQILGESQYDLESFEKMESIRGELGLGNLIADSFRTAVQKAEGKNGDFLNAAVQPLGEIRGTLTAGPIQVDDVFQALSLGQGVDKTPGYPLLSFYLTGKEIKNCLETQSTVAPLKSDYCLQVSGVKFKYNPNRVPFDRVQEIKISTPSGYENIQPDKLYRICTSYMTGVMLGKMGSISYGIISVTPKDKDGQPIKDLKTALIDAKPDQPGIQELKEWKCLADYLKIQPDLDKDGIPDLPAYYQQPAGRYQAVASWNPVDLLKNSTYLTWGFIAISFLVIALLFLLIRGIIRLFTGKRAPIHPAG